MPPTNTVPAGWLEASIDAANASYRSLDIRSILSLVVSIITLIGLLVLIYFLRKSYGKYKECLEQLDQLAAVMNKCSEHLAEVVGLDNVMIMLKDQLAGAPATSGFEDLGELEEETGLSEASEPCGQSAADLSLDNFEEEPEPEPEEVIASAGERPLDGLMAVALEEAVVDETPRKENSSEE